MGYTHYWRRVPELNGARFSKAVEDVRLVLAKLKEGGMKLAGPLGTGEPDLSAFSIAFNGLAACGHRYRDLGHPWPSKTAHGIEATPDPIVGPWFSGAMIETRVCGGCCAGGPFVVDREFMMREWDQAENGKYFAYCETGFKPYDLAVTAALIRLKEHFKDDIVITTDGYEHGFEDAKRLCRELFGWAGNFVLEPLESSAV